MANADAWTALSHDDLSHGPIQNIAYWLGQIGYAPTTSALVFNVMSYGATGKGTIDDTAAIQAAYTAAAAAGGGIVFFPPGVYLVAAGKSPAGLNLPSGVILQGSGELATTILGYLPASSGGSGTIIHLNGTQAGGLGTAITLADKVWIKDMTLNLNGGPSAQNPNGPFYTNITGVSHYWYYDIGFESVTITNNGQRGRLVATPPQNNLIESWRVTYNHCTFSNFQNDKHIEAMEFDDCDWVVFNDCEWFNCQFGCVNLYQQVKHGVFNDCYMHDGSIAPANATGVNGIIWTQAATQLVIINFRAERLWGPAIQDGGSSVSGDAWGTLNPPYLVVKGFYAEDCTQGINLIGPTGFSIEDFQCKNLQQAGLVVGSSRTPRHGTLQRALFWNCGKAQGSFGSQAGIQFNNPAGQSYNLDFKMRDVTCLDDQVTPTMLYGLYIGVGASNVLNGLTVEDSDLSRVGVPVEIGSGTLGPSSVFRNVKGVNPTGVISTSIGGSGALSLNTTGKATQNIANVDGQVYLTGGTVTGLALGAMAEPTFTPSVAVLSSGGSGFTTGTTTLGIQWSNATGGTTLSPTTSFNIAASTNSLVVSALPTPTNAITPTVIAGNGSLPAGTYYPAYSYYNEIGETPVLTLGSVSITVPTGTNPFDTINFPTMNSPPTGVLGARYYFVTGSGSVAGTIGLVAIQPINSGGNIPSVQVNTGPSAIPAPTVTPTVTQITSYGENQFNPGVTNFYMTYITMGGNETLPGPQAPPITITATGALQIGPFNLDTFLPTGAQGNGQINVQWVRVYALGANIGLLAQFPTILNNGVLAVGQQTIWGVASTQAVPIVDISLPKTNTPGVTFRTDGFPTPAMATSGKAFFTTGGTTWGLPGPALVSGTLQPFILTSPGSTSSLPTVNTTGTQIATATPVNFPLAAGECYIWTGSGAPTQVFLGH